MFLLVVLQVHLAVVVQVAPLVVAAQAHLALVVLQAAQAHPQAAHRLVPHQAHLVLQVPVVLVVLQCHKTKLNLKPLLQPTKT